MLKKFALRKIKNGRVKINGHIFVPEDQFMKYDGRLDNMWYVFGLYYRGNEFQNFVSLWGSKEMSEASATKEFKYGPDLVDGYFPWVWWREA